MNTLQDIRDLRLHIPSTRWSNNGVLIKDTSVITMDLNPHSADHKHQCLRPVCKAALPWHATLFGLQWNCCILFAKLKSYFLYFYFYRVCPIFQVSNVTGENLPLLKTFLNLLSTRMHCDVNEPAEFQIDETYSVPVSHHKWHLNLSFCCSTQNYLSNLPSQFPFWFNTWYLQCQSDLQINPFWLPQLSKPSRMVPVLSNMQQFSYETVFQRFSNRLRHQIKSKPGWKHICLLCTIIVDFLFTVHRDLMVICAI